MHQLIFWTFITGFAWLLARAAVRSWGRPERFDASWAWTRPAPSRSGRPLGPQRPRDILMVASMAERIDRQSRAGTAVIEAGPAAIAAVSADPGMLTSSERAAALDEWIRGGVGALDDALAGALDSFRAAVEPAMRKARLWELQGQSGRGAAPAARAALDRWRIDSPTAEWPIVRPRVIG